MREMKIMADLNSKYLLRYITTMKTDNNYYLFLEFWNGGDLRRFVDKRGGKLEEPLAREILKQIGKGLIYLKKKNIVHRDLKLENILLNFPDKDKSKSVSDKFLKKFDLNKDKIEVLIGDLGFARSVKDDNFLVSYWGTPLYVAPEMMNGEHYGPKIDIWSFGIIAYELMVGFTPFTGNDMDDLEDNINSGKYGIPKEVKLSVNCLKLLNWCLQFYPDKRIDHKGLLKHPFFLENEPQMNMSLAVSRISGKTFDMPESSSEVDEDNATIFSIKDSWLFNDTYAKCLNKYKQRIKEQNKNDKVDENNSESDDSSTSPNPSKQKVSKKKKRMSDEDSLSSDEEEKSNKKIDSSKKKDSINNNNSQHTQDIENKDEEIKEKKTKKISKDKSDKDEAKIDDKPKKK